MKNQEKMSPKEHKKPLVTDPQEMERHEQPDREFTSEYSAKEFNDSGKQHKNKISSTDTDSIKKNQTTFGTEA